MSDSPETDAPKSHLRIGLLQLLAAGQDLDANLWIGDRACRRAREMGADLALFPEMWSIGYAVCPDDETGRTEWASFAVETEGPFVEHFRALAQELRMAIAITYLQAWEPAPRNAASIIDHHGNVVCTYAKVHTCDSWMERACTPGQEFVVCELPTAEGPIQLGAMICYDREFPESARVLMLKGAEIIVTPNACRLDAPRLGQFAARAYENMVGVAMANYASPQQNGHSVAFSPIVYDGDENTLDPALIEAGAEEGIYLADFDIEAIRKYRRLETQGDAYRKPKAYGALVDAEQLDVFRRPDARGRA